MTRKKAKEILEEVKAIDDSMYQYNSAYLEALNMAIAALKAEPCEDAVSRGHLLSEIDKLMQSPWFNNGKDDDTITHHGYIERKEAVEVVRDLCVKTEPPVAPKQRQGKWIHEEDAIGLGGYYRCSCCGKSALYRRGAMKMLNEKTTFCPHCGAKMEGE